MPLLEIKDLHIEFGRGPAAVRAVDGVSLSLEPGETLGLVGESGSGKSLTALSIARLLPSPAAQVTRGQILLDGRDVLALSARELRQIRGGVAGYVFQEPGSSLNPVYPVGWLLKEALRIHRPESATSTEAARLLQRVGVPSPELRLRSYPHELSGGLQQRVMIAIAIAARPKLLIADEPTTALDVTIQAQILELLRQLQAELRMAILLISHNLALVAGLAHRIAVIYAGQIVETGATRDLLDRPLHPYTRALLASVPRLGEHTGRLRAIPGSPPLPGMPPPGCRFHPRCSLAQPACATQPAGIHQPTPGRMVRCSPAFSL